MKKLFSNVGFCFVSLLVVMLICFSIGFVVKLALGLLFAVGSSLLLVTTALGALLIVVVWVLHGVYIVCFTKRRPKQYTFS